MHYRTRFDLLKKVFLFGLLMLMLSSGAAWAEIKVMTLRHVSVDSVLPMVRELLQGRGQVSKWENRLIINATTDEISTIEEVLGKIDIAPVMLRIAVRTENRPAQAGNRIGTAIMGPGASVAHTANGPGPGGEGASRLAERSSPAERRLGNAGEETEYYLRVRDGGQGFIMIGKSVPYVREMLVLAGRHAAGYGQSVDFQAINTGFWVRPVLDGDTASLDIRPHLEGFQKSAAGPGGLPQSIDLQSLVTTVRVPLGRWVDLGGFLREADEVSRAVVTWRTGNSREEKTIWIKVDRQQEP
jgi:hypothetical protein